MRFLALLPRLLLLSLLTSCASMMEFDGDVNSRIFSDYVMGEIFNRPVSELFQEAQPSSNGKDIYVIKKMPSSVRFYTSPYSKSLYPPQCRKVRKDLVTVKLTKRSNSFDKNSEIIDVEFGLEKWDYQGGRCVSSEQLMPLVHYFGGRPPMHYVHFGHNSIFLSQLIAKGFPVKSYSEQCTASTFKSNRNISNEEALRCFFDGPSPSMTVQEQRLVLEDLRFEGLVVEKREQSKTLSQIYNERLSDREYRSKVNGYKNKIISIVEEYHKRKRVEDNKLAAQDRKNERQDSNFFSKALTIAAIAGLASNSGLSSVEAFDAVSPVLKSVITGESVNPYDESRLRGYMDKGASYGPGSEKTYGPASLNSTGGAGYEGSRGSPISDKAGTATRGPGPGCPARPVQLGKFCPQQIVNNRVGPPSAECLQEAEAVRADNEAEYAAWEAQQTQQCLDYWKRDRDSGKSRAK